jgi:hypothetical protein
MARPRRLRREPEQERPPHDPRGLRTEAAHDWRHAADHAEQLFRDAFRRRNGRWPRLEPHLFAELAAIPTPGLWAQLTWRGGRLVGFSFNLEAAGVVDGTFAALADVPERGAIYANDLVYQPVALGAAAGYRRLELGPTALRAKRLRGATLHPRVTLVRGASRALRVLLRGLAVGVRVRTAWKERHLA